MTPLPCNPTNSEGKPSIWSGFYRKTLQERQDQIELVYPHLGHPQSLSPQVADNMIENCIGIFELPLGLGLNFVINDSPYSIPMAIEEPSVIAAVSGAAKTISGSGGFKTFSSGNLMQAQIQLLDVADVDIAVKKIVQSKAKLVFYGNQHCHNMVKRGGGIVDIYPRVIRYNSEKYSKIHDKSSYLKFHGCIDQYMTSSNENVQHQKSEVEGPSVIESCAVDEPDRTSASRQFSSQSISQVESPSSSEHKTAYAAMIIVHVVINVCESMGANLATTVAEGLAPKLLEVSNSGRYLLRIVTNRCDQRRAKATFCIPTSKLKYKNVDGQQISRGIIDAYMMACEDPYRATTHNKGIMNGIDATAIALGQDWRAIEAAAHAWASRSGAYKPLTHYALLRDSESQLYLFGSCEIPVPVGVRGGVIHTHPMVQYTHDLLNNPTSRQLGEILAAVGLAQNFASLRALITEGIQRGHMSLHSRNIAISAGAQPHLVAEVSAYMISRNLINFETATDYLRAHSILASSTQHRFKSQPHVIPSTMFVELELEKQTTALNIVFETIGKRPVHLAIRDDTSETGELSEDAAIQAQLFSSKTHSWLKNIFALFEICVFSSRAYQLASVSQNLLQFRNKLKLLSILINILAYRLIFLYPDITVNFLEKILAAELNPLSMVTENHPCALRVGFSLILALWQVFKHQVDATITLASLNNAIKEEQLRIFGAVYRNVNLNNSSSFGQFMITHSKRWQVTMFLLCDLLIVPHHLITSRRLFLTFKIGKYLEYESAIAHDLMTWERDQKQGIINSYLFWLKHNQKTHSPESQKAFLEMTTAFCERKRRKLMQVKEPVEFFDTDLFLNAIPLIKAYYQSEIDWKESKVDSSNIKAKM
ncbi:uncharacterized protein LOC126320410 [Schistocerca gregaria]|uniref:uncharacterized protein LOC126320410 n=1 Tax=Schistocerca gregaria TaxID=7010 RepID=UPI00211E9A44|nr:uncharacterized protein LOC126320410 [Schistocerca gregaria]